MKPAQERIWLKKMLELEFQFLAHITRYPQEALDGSFMMCAFKQGYYNAQRLAAKQRKDGVTL